ncbi:hypothetical protein [Burkholderia vietnamiensis]|uniref:hypothetical protein n=1 Tax=Burkholderia vietnamiensis TaxID=60552 RepID=UPI001CAE8363|nr:hypothetical protein [Burkholderia vietnamiensis]CAG9228664.1 hypothetical protein BVI1335_70075 [Burkholderia vietnamiensis]
MIFSPHSRCFPVVETRFAFLKKVHDGEQGLFTTDDFGNLVRVNPYHAAASLV